jgi:FlaA1/EpsC-like NDP-sugar epimerase
LLGREPVQLDEARIAANLTGHCLLVTGAGGSIGSELTRQAAKAGVAKLVLFERAESDLFDIEVDLRHRFPSLDIETIVGDVLDVEHLADVFARERPSRVCHAAAYKHVPLMERHVLAAVRNNIIGTANVARAAAAVGTEQFVLVSSDKAIRPSSLMGATKRAAERVVLSCFGGPARGTAVRFGNVLGSRGSVVPLFQRQIAAGGPVTVTSPSALRYFMTVSEAVQLVLHASAISSGGEIFHLDMGEPVRIVDLAEQLVRLSGLEPGTDIQVVFTGLRPGEKLAESLGAEGGRIEATQHPRIKVWRDGGADRLESAWLDELTAAADRRDTSALVQLVRAAVPDYLPSSLVLEDLSTDVGTAAGMGPAVRAG